MKENRSLDISYALQSINIESMFSQLDEFIQIDKSKYCQKTDTRDRIYTYENTFKLMLLSGFEKDKSFSNIVSLFKNKFDLLNALKIEKENEKLLKEETDYLKMENYKRGRPRKFKSRIKKSHKKEMSLNTAAFSKAKDRLPLELIKEGYNKSKEVEQTHKSLFHNMEVLITDGTYLQLQDTKDIQKNYGTTKGQGYPKGLLQSLIGYGNGIIIDFEFDSYKKSELSLVQNIINRLENNKLLLADDLYNSYGIFSLIQKKNCHIIVPGKRIRNYTVVKCLEKGDEIVELKKAKTNKVFTKKDWESFDNTLKIRRISFKLPNKEEDVILYTTLVDKEITKEEIILLYQSRWDIEINIREIKTIMGMSVIRSKTQNNVLKEVYVTITSYNIARKIIQKSVEKTDFPPQKDILEKIYTINSNILMDKSGRVYNHWSSGRKRKIISENIKTENNTKT